LNFYKDALEQLPIKRKQLDFDDGIRDLEIKIAFAYQALGKNLEAIECYEAIIEKYFGFRFPVKKPAMVIKGILSMFSFMFMINNQSLFFKKEVDEHFHLYIGILKEWGEAMSTANPKRLTFILFRYLVYISRYQLNKSIRGLTVFVECCSLFMWTGISFSVSQKMLDYAKQAHIDEHSESRISYRYSLKMHEFMTGKWEVDDDFNELFEQSNKLGQFWPLTIYTLFSGMESIELGDMLNFENSMEKMNEIYESFDNMHARAQMLRTQTIGYFRSGNLIQPLILQMKELHIHEKQGIMQC